MIGEYIMLYIKNNEIKDSKKINVVINGFRYFNPSEEQIIADGWQPYTFPTSTQSEIPLDEVYKNKIIELIRQKYSIDDELAILRQRDTKIEEFDIYNSFVEECKILARKDVYE